MTAASHPVNSTATVAATVPREALVTAWTRESVRPAGPRSNGHGDIHCARTAAIAFGSA